MTANNIQNPEDHVFKVLKADIFSPRKINHKQSAVCLLQKNTLFPMF